MKVVDKKNLEDIFSLTPMQQGMLFNYLKDTGNDYYFEQLSLEITGEIDGGLFEKAWSFVVETNEMLRAAFRWEEIERPIQFILKEHRLELDVHDLSTAEANQVDIALEEIKAKDRQRGFDLHSVPFRVILCKTGEHKYEMIISNHHILYDGWSTGIILKEFLRAYNDLAHGKKPETPIKTKYKEFVKWIRSRDAGEQERFWKDYLDGFDSKSFLSVKRQTGRESRIKRHKFEIPPTFMEGIDNFIKEHKVTMASILYAAWGILLRKYCHEDAVAFGTTVAGRSAEINDVGNIVGLFINTIPFIMNPPDGSTLLELVRDTSRALSVREQYESTSLMDIQQYNRGEDAANMFDSIVVLENYPLDGFLTQHGGTLRLRRYEMIYRTEYDLSVVISTFKHLKVTLTYDSGYFSDEAIEGIGRHFETIIENIIQHSQKQIVGVDLLSVAEKQQLLVDFNDSGAQYPGDTTVSRLFEAQAEKHPGNVAVLFDNEQMTYRQLNEKANRLAARLRRKGGIKPDRVIGILMDNCPELLVSILAVLKTGATYMPLSPDYPEARINWIIKDSGATLLLSSGEMAEKEKTVAPRFPGLEIIRSDDGDLSHGNPGPPEAAFDNNENRGNLAYILYTSGTTGKPKGVAVHHKGLCNYLWFAKENYVKNETVNFPLFTSISFDLTVTSLFTPLISGNAVVVYHDDHKEFLVERIIDERRVQVMKLTPAHLKILRDIKKDWTKTPAVIRRLIVGGEDLKTQLAKDIHTIFGGEVEIYNEYGPTETVVGCMIHRFDPETDQRPSVPIGKPASNTQIYILDADGTPVPKEVIGELCIAGHGVTPGYLNKPELTFEKYISSPLSPGSAIYRSGDLARWLPDGSIQFLGRKDHQVKIRGYRIEPGEIENKLKNYGRDSGSVHFQPNIRVSMQRLKRETRRCTKCLLPANYPGITFNKDGVCNTCLEFDKFKDHTKRYFKTVDDLHLKVEELKKKRSRDSEYDCLLLYSGGKDSSYVLYKLVDMGLKVLTYTFDNGYISDSAFKNIKYMTSSLNIDHIVSTSKNMGAIFNESLKTHNTVCTGCWRVLNTHGGKLAHERGINMVVSGLSPGQIFDHQLHALFSAGIFEEEEIEEQLKMMRRVYYSREEKLSRLMNTKLSGDAVEEIEFVDYFRYDDSPVNEIVSYLKSKNWSMPEDTGFCSTNCLINDVGIYTHIKEKGYHNYAAPLSWDLRYGVITREKGLKELEFKSDPDRIQRILNEVGYFDDTSVAIKDTVVVDKQDQQGNPYLCAYFVSDEDINVSQLRDYLAGELPDYMIPSYFIKVDKIPLTANGKVNRHALPNMEGVRPRLDVEYVIPSTEMEKKISAICEKVLDIDKVGIHDNFFDLGAQSFHVVKINNELKEIVGKDVPIVKIFTHSTIHKLANHLYPGNGGGNDSTAKTDRSEEVLQGRNKLRARKKSLQRVG